MSLTNIEQKVKGGEESICKTCAHNKVCWYMNNQPCIVCSQYAAQERHGRWDMVNGAGMVHCSACDNWAHKKTAISFYDYCSNCGAKMDADSDLSEKSIATKMI